MRLVCRVAVLDCDGFVAAPPSELGPARRSASSRRAGTFGARGWSHLALKREGRSLFESSVLGVGRPGFHLYVLKGGSELLIASVL